MEVPWNSAGRPLRNVSDIILSLSLTESYSRRTLDVVQSAICRQGPGNEDDCVVILMCLTLRANGE